MVVSNILKYGSPKRQECKTKQVQFAKCWVNKPTTSNQSPALVSLITWQWDSPSNCSKHPSIQTGVHTSSINRHVCPVLTCKWDDQVRVRNTTWPLQGTHIPPAVSSHCTRGGELHLGQTGPAGSEDLTDHCNKAWSLLFNTYRLFIQMCHALETWTASDSDTNSGQSHLYTGTLHNLCVTHSNIEMFKTVSCPVATWKHQSVVFCVSVRFWNHLFLSDFSAVLAFTEPLHSLSTETVAPGVCFFLSLSKEKRRRRSQGQWSRR